MTHEAIHNAIRGRFGTLIETAQSLVTVYDNQTDQSVPEAEIWCRFTVRPGTARQVTLGVKRFRVPGIAIVQLFNLVGTGDGDLLAMADIIQASFRAVAVDGIHYGTPYVTNAGRDDSYWQVNVTIPFFADHQEA